MIASARAAFAARSRVIVAAAAFTVAATRVLADGRGAISADSPYRALFAAVPCATIVAIARYRRIHRLVHVHDRQVDLIAAWIIAGFLVASLDLFTPRLGWAQSSVRLELFFAPAVVLAIVLPLFGTRAVLEQLPAMNVLWTAWPLPYTLVGMFLPTELLFWVILAAVLAATLASLAEWNPIWGFIAHMLGFLTACIVAKVTNFGPASILAAVAFVTGMATIKRTRWLWQANRPREENRVTAAPHSRNAIAPVFVLAILLALSPANALLATTKPSNAAQISTSRCPDVPQWRGTRRLVAGDLSRHRLGRWMTQRCTYETDVHHHERKVTVDISEPVSTFELGAFPLPTVFHPFGTLAYDVDTFRVLDSKADAFVWRDGFSFDELVAASMYVRVTSYSWQRVTVMMESAKHPKPLPSLAPTPFRSLAQQVGLTVRIQPDEDIVLTPEARDAATVRSLTRHFMAGAS